MERSRTRLIQGFIVDHVDHDPKGIARRVAQAYGISRQAANRHLDTLVDAGILNQAGQTRAREYMLRRMSAVSREFRVTPVLNADRVWAEHAAPVLAGDRVVVRDACRGIFKELLENVIAHAGASWISFEFATTARQIDLALTDDGMGVFASLAPKLRLPTPRDAAEEIARRARDRSTDPPAARLTVLARSTDGFWLSSAGVTCEFDAASDEWSVREDGRIRTGTLVACRLQRTPSRDAPHRS